MFPCRGEVAPCQRAPGSIWESSVAVKRGQETGFGACARVARMLSRREVLALGAAPLLLGKAPLFQTGRHVVVVGAGAFGGWTAWWLARRGARVTVVDAWGPGNMRASSGGETRVIRGSYGDRAIYTTMAARALTHWRDREREWGAPLYTRTGALWMFGKDDSFANASVPLMADAGFPAERPSIAEARKRWPQISFEGISSTLFEPEAGYLLARRSCAEVLERARSLGAQFRMAAVRPPALSKAIDRIALEGGGTIAADAFVFACGPWLGRLFPDVIGDRVRATRQEVFYFGPPAGDTRFEEPSMPVWVDYRDRLIYGIPATPFAGSRSLTTPRARRSIPLTATVARHPQRLRMRARFSASASLPSPTPHSLARKSVSTNSPPTATSSSIVIQPPRTSGSPVAVRVTASRWGRPSAR